MSRRVFFGRVLLERIPLRIGLPTPLGWSGEVNELGVKYNAEFRCADGQTVAQATVTEGATDVHTLRNLVEQNIRAYVDAIGYVEGLNYDLDFISAVSLETGEGTIFGIKIPAIAEARDPKKSGAISSDLLIAVVSEPVAQIALADFREAISRDNLDENGAAIRMRTGGRENKNNCAEPRLVQALFDGAVPVANGALRTWLDLQLAPPNRD